MQKSPNGWGFVGNSWAVDLLKRHVIRSRVGEGGLPHAFLFCGPTGVGRRTLAVRFMQALNCSAPPAEGDPCLACSACKALEEAKHPDLSIIQASQEGGVLRIEQIREMLSTLSLSPYAASFRMVLLLRFEEANQNAANALLKSLEEPPPHVLFFLTASREEDVLPTIASRCQTFTLKPSGLEYLTEKLIEINKMAREKAQLLAHLSNGRYGYACRLDQDPQILSLREEWLDDLVQLVGASLPQRFRFAEKMADFRHKTPDAAMVMKQNLRAMVQNWISFWRDVMVYAISHLPEGLTNIDRLAEIERFSTQIDAELAHAILRRTEALFARWERNVNARLALEDYLLEIPRLTGG